MVNRYDVFRWQKLVLHMEAQPGTVDVHLCSCAVCKPVKHLISLLRRRRCDLQHCCSHSLAQAIQF